MNHNLRDVDPTVQPEHSFRHLSRKVFATLGMVASTMSLSGGDVIDQTSYFEQPVPTNSRVIYEPTPEDTVIVLPHITMPDKDMFYPKYPGMSERIKQLDDNCQSVEVSLPKNFEYKAIVKGAETEFAISTREYQEAYYELEASDSFAETQAVVTRVLKTLDIQAKYDAPVGGTYRSSPGAALRSTSDVNEYTRGLVKYLAGFATMPREMFSEVKSINFINAEGFYGSEADKRAKQAAIGTYGGLGEITLSILSSSPKVLAHEVTHSFHGDKSCQKHDDVVLKDEHADALTFLKTNEITRETEAKFKNDENSYTDEESSWHDEYIKQGKLSGFPSGYSRTNHIEYLGDEILYLIYDRGYIGDVEQVVNQRDSAIDLKQLTVNRMQKAMPHTDINGYLQYMNTYTAIDPTKLDPKDTIKYKVSPLDKTFSLYYYMKPKLPINEPKLRPAITIKSGEGVPDQYVYAYRSPNGKYNDIYINDIYGSGTTDLLVKAAVNYLTSLPGVKGGKPSIEHIGEKYEDKAILVTLVDPSKKEGKQHS